MSTTVTIPGGTAELYDPQELTPRRRIPGKALLFRARRPASQARSRPESHLTQWRR